MSVLDLQAIPDAGPSRPQPQLRLIPGRDTWERGGSGEGITTTASAITSYLDGPPLSTITKDRSLHPNIAGSSAGFIALVSGIAVVVIASLFLGYYLYNRARHRIPSKRHPMPSLSVAGAQAADPYAETPNAHPTPYDDPDGDFETTPRAARFAGLGIGLTSSGRPGYARQRSSEWEIPQIDITPGSRAESQQKKWKGKGKEEWVNVDMPNEPDEAAYPLRSRSPRPLSPHPSPKLYSATSPGWSEIGGDEVGNEATRGGKGKERANPFDDPLDAARLSPTFVTARRLQSAISIEDQHSQDDQDDQRNEASANAGDGQVYLRVDTAAPGVAGPSSGGSTPTSGTTYESVYMDRVEDGEHGRFVERFQSTETLR